MTRLEKDATKRLIILGTVITTVAIIFIFSRQIFPCMAGFALMGLLGFVGLSKEKGPELNEDKLKKVQKWSIVPIIFILLILGFQCKNIFLQIDKGFAVNFGAILSTVLILICFLFLIIRRKKIFIKKTIKLPKYDEREEIVLKTAHSIAFAVFWLIFVFASVAANLSMRDKQIPAFILSIQILVSWWIYSCTYNIAIFWQQRKLSSDFVGILKNHT